MENKKEKNKESKIEEPIKSILDIFYNSAGYTKSGQKPVSDEKRSDKKRSKENSLDTSSDNKTLDFNL